MDRMEEVVRTARVAIERCEANNAPQIRFSVCEMRCRMGLPKTGWRWVTTDCHDIVKFFLACWNARHELATLHAGRQ